MLTARKLSTATLQEVVSWYQQQDTRLLAGRLVIEAACSQVLSLSIDFEGAARFSPSDSDGRFRL